jgi:hypothetical protein
MFALRFLGLVTLAIWIGGFTFYSAAVVPVLHQALSTAEAGSITRRVTVALNAIGVAALALGWWLAVAERGQGTARRRRARLGLLAATTAALAGLIALHRVMDHRLDAGLLRGFYPLHRAYLIVSTAQWFVNLGLLGLAVDGREARRDAPTPG